MATQAAMPNYGDILNAGIQTVKYFASRPNGIPEKTFLNHLERLLNITDEHYMIGYIDKELSHIVDDKSEAFQSGWIFLFNLMIQNLAAIGMIKDMGFNLQPNSQGLLSLVSFNETVMPNNLIKIDPFGQIYFWLCAFNFIEYFGAGVSSSQSSYLANLERYDNHSFHDLKQVNKACYGKDGDPLLNHFIEETMRRTSVFMNNYGNVVVGNDFVKVTTEMLSQQINSLSPTQFEHLCLNVVETALKNESPTSVIRSKHMGKSNDNGIDGSVTQEFENGEIHYYYIQAKLYAQGNNISNSAIRNFLGAYPAHEHHHGLFITTSDFTDPAKNFSAESSHSIVLINMINLMDLMLEHEIGVERAQTETLVMNRKYFQKLKRY